MADQTHGIPSPDVLRVPAEDVLCVETPGVPVADVVRNACEDVIQDEVRSAAGKLSAPSLAAVRTLIRKGNKLEAIKRLREELRLSLREAKDMVDVLAREENSRTAPAPNMPEIRQLVAQGRKLEAIKRLREELRLSLSEAKDMVDAMEVR